MIPHRLEAGRTDNSIGGQSESVVKCEFHAVGAAARRRYLTL